MIKNKKEGEMKRLENKVAIVTGCASGIGRNTAILFANEGAKVSAADFNNEGEETVELIKKSGGDAIFVKTDVSKSEDIKNLVNKTLEAFSKVNILANIAGIVPAEGGTVGCTEEIFLKVIMTNLVGTWLGMKYAIPEIERVGGGSIINMTSIASIRAYGNIPAYAASKGGIMSMSQDTAIEYASKNIRVNCISPGNIATPMLLNCWSDEVLNHMANTNPQKRLGKPEEVAQVILFLASDESSHVNGANIPVCGGITVKAP
jgi:NAD(P)-dependent dehydrogenase (short-subunit alcohol dehydrogenase family)